jgi:regulatory protein
MRNSELEDKELTRAKNAAYRFLTYRPRSRKEVEDKLREKQFSDSVIDEVLADLDRLGYMNDREFAQQWARSRVRLRGYGKRRIEHELTGKGISSDIIDEALGAVFKESSETDIARLEAEKKLKSLSRFEPEIRRRRLAGYLERKGFSSAVISTILRAFR